MTECLDGGIEPGRLRGIGLQRRDDDEHARAREHYALGYVTGDADRRDSCSARDAQVFQELLGSAFVDVVSTDCDETQRHHDEKGFAPA